MATGKTLHRSRGNRVIAGVCGGLEQFFGIDAVWFRIGFAVAAIPGGVPGILAYLVCWVIIPAE
jgi:phage shock protein C